MAYLKLFLTPISSLVQRSLPSFVTVICSSGQERKRIFFSVFQWHAKGVDLEQQDDASRSHVVPIKHNPNTEFLNMTEKKLLLWTTMLGLHIECSHLPKGSLLQNIYIESLPLVISTIAACQECSCILLDTHALILLTLSTVLQEICFPKACAQACWLLS